MDGGLTAWGPVLEGFGWELSRLPSEAESCVVVLVVVTVVVLVTATFLIPVGLTLLAGPAGSLAGAACTEGRRGDVEVSSPAISSAASSAG